MVEYPRLQELITKSFVSLAAHSVLVYQGFKNLSDVLLLKETIVSC